MTIDTAVILAAGEGTRLRPLTTHRPKPMLPAGNIPILEHVLNSLVEAGISEIHLVVGYQRARVQNHFGSTYRNRPITYHIQHTQLGSGHALLQADETIETDFLVLNGDQIVTEEMIETVSSSHTATDTATLGVVESEKASQYGAVELNDNRITEFIEQPADDEYRLLNAGVYVFGPSIFAALERTFQEQGRLSLPETIRDLTTDESAVRGVVTESPWQDATYPWDLLSVMQTLFDQDRIGDETTEQSPGVFSDQTATIHEDATLRPPVIVSADTVVGPQAVLGPGVAVGENTTIGAGAVLTNVLVDSDTRVGQNATLIDTVLGQGVHLGPGVIIAGGPADIRIDTKVHEDCDLGGVIADRATVGGGVTVASGSLVGSAATIQSNAHIDGNIPNEAEVLR